MSDIYVFRSEIIIENNFLKQITVICQIWGKMSPNCHIFLKTEKNVDPFTSLITFVGSEKIAKTEVNHTAMVSSIEAVMDKNSRCILGNYRKKKLYSGNGKRPLVLGL